jgi:predicted acyl esterase
VAQYKSEVRDGMRIDWDVPIPMEDGMILRADVFRPVAEGRYPVIMSHGPYAKGLSFQDGFPWAWTPLVTDHPEVLAGSSGKYQVWETADPEKWVPDGYVCVRVDSRGAGRDFEFPSDGRRPAVYGVQMKGNGIFLHTDSHDRPADVFAGTTTLVSGPGQAAYLLLPFIPRTGGER